MHHLRYNHKHSSSLSSTGSSGSDDSNSTDAIIPPRSSALHQKRVLNAYRALQRTANNAASPAIDPEPHFRLAKFVLDFHSSLIPSLDIMDRHIIIRDALSMVSLLAGGVQLLPPQQPSPKRHSISSSTSSLDPPSSSLEYPPALLLAANLLVAGLPFQTIKNGHILPTNSHNHKPRYKEAFSLYLRAADADSADAAHNAALLLDHGRVHLTPTTSTPHPTSTRKATAAAALNLPISAASMNHPGSLLCLHNLYKAVEALQLLEKAVKHANAIHPEPLLVLANLLNNPALHKQNTSSPSPPTLVAPLKIRPWKPFNSWKRPSKHANAIHPEPLLVLANLLNNPALHLVLGGGMGRLAVLKNLFISCFNPRLPPSSPQSLLERAAALGHEPSRACLGWRDGASSRSLKKLFLSCFNPRLPPSSPQSLLERAAALGHEPSRACLGWRDEASSRS
ncbi:hypothetical protein BC829DRAFT_492730 [Chytridium lagenaria]|nr:hypothetical protein BC829DRAFT_492730 [Chytridium lagenaria]